MENMFIFVLIVKVVEFMALPYPNIGSVIFSVGPLHVQWYGLAYVAGILGGWRYGEWMLRRYPNGITQKLLEGFSLWAMMSIVLGGRLGHVLFYELDYYIDHPLQILMTWRGGMSFHGGVLGALIGAVFYSWFRRVSLLSFMDVLALICPIGLGLGRVTNFINAELYGRATDMPWGFVFPGAGALVRHPTQLYEALLEGAVLFLALNLLWRKTRWRHSPGRVSGVFFILYGVFRFFVEYFRETAVANLGLVWGGLTMGQVLSVPLMLAGVVLVLRLGRQREHRSYSIEGA